MVFKWRDSHTEIFLEIFKGHQELWNHKLPSYKDKNKRNKAISEMCEELNRNTLLEAVKEEDIKLKIKTIRTKYMSELAKVRNSTKSGCSSADIYIPTVFWYKQADEFLGSVCDLRTSTDNLNLIEVNNPSIGESDGLEYAINNSSHTVKNTQEAAVGSQAHTQPSAENPNPPKVVGSQSQSNSFKRKRLNVSSVDSAIKELKLINETNQENEFDAFCRSLAIQLNKMPLSRALACQEKLQAVMKQERLAILNDTLDNNSSMSNSQYSDENSSLQESQTLGENDNEEHIITNNQMYFPPDAVHDYIVTYSDDKIDEIVISDD